MNASLVKVAKDNLLKPFLQAPHILHSQILLASVEASMFYRN